MDDFGNMPGADQPTGTPRQEDIQNFETEVMQPIPEVRGLLVNRLHLIGEENMAVLDQGLTPDVGRVLKMVLPEIGDIIEQVSMANTQKSPSVATAAQQPMPGQGAMAQGGLGPVSGAGEQFGAAQPQMMGQGGPMQPRPPGASSPLGRIS